LNFTTPEKLGTLSLHHFVYSEDSCSSEIKNNNSLARNVISMASVQRLNHAVLYVGDVDRSVAFYTSTLGFDVAHALKGAAFLRAKGSANDHDLGLFTIGTQTPGPQPGRRGLYHLAWQVDTIDDLVAIRALLQEAGSLVGESDHGTSKSLYAQDPDGIEFEVMWATPQSAGPQEMGTRHLNLSAEQTQWSGVATGHEANV
jgi:catechol-2,3-dioxygenase